MKHAIELPAMRRAAELAPGSVDIEGRTVEVIWSTGARIRRVPFFGEAYDEELSLDPAHVRLDRLNAGAPFLRVHQMRDLDAVIGSVLPESARIEEGRGIATLRVSERENVGAIWEDIQAGHLRAVSIGYQVHRYEVSKPDGGRELWRAVDWTPFEISAVPVGADPNAGFRTTQDLYDCVVDRAGVTSSTERNQTMKDQTRTNDEATGAPKTAVAIAAGAAEAQAAPPVTAQTDSGTTEVRVTAEAPNTGAAEARAAASAAATGTTRPAGTDALVADARDAERERIATIHDLASRLGLERSVADDLVKRGVSLDEARREILDSLVGASERTETFGHVSVPLDGRDETVTRREAIAGALLHRYSPTLFELEEAGHQYRGMTLMELARESLGEAGVNTRGMSRDEVATRALHSTSDFPEILAAATNKTLRQAYEAYPRTFLGFCRQVLATDFMAMHRVQISEAPQLLKVSEGGEFQRGTLAESKESYRIETYGRVVAITRQVLINDDLDAFTRIPAMYGNSIAQLESDVVWGIVTGNAAMADGKALFHADHKNLAGTAAALGVEAVGAARATMSKQKGLDKKTVLNIRPAYLLVPAALELKAEQLLAHSLVPAESEHMVPQSIRTLTTIAEPRLDGSSDTAWYLAASPMQIDTIEYAYLEGQQCAYVETRNGFDVDGVEIKCRLDFGAKAIDWRGLHKNAGA